MRKKIFAILLVFILPIYIFCNDKYSENYILNFYIDVLFSKDRDSMFNYTDKYKDFDLYDMDGIWKIKWYEGFEPESIKFYFDDNEIGIGEGHYFCYQNIEHKKINTIYYSGNESELNKQSDRYSAIDWSPVRKFNDFILIFEYEGDYLNIYFNEDIKSNLLATFCRVTQETYKEFESLVHYNLCDLSKVTWPRHADGTCDYDGSKKAVTVQTAAEEPVFILRQNSILKDENLDKKSFKQGEKFTFKYNKKGLGVDINEPLTISIPLYNFSDNQRYKIPINDVYLADYDFKIGENISKDYWIPSYYYDLLKSNTPLDDVLKYEKYWANFTFVAEDEPKWYEFFGIQRYYFGDFYIVVFGSEGYKDVDFFAYLGEVSDTKIVYNVQKMYSHYFDYKEEVSYNQPEFLPLFEKETPFKIFLTLDGDYMKMYIDEVSEENLFQTLIRTTPEACNQIEKWIKCESDDLSKVVIPKKLSIQNESSKATSSTKVAPNKTMTVSENLKLRSAEATTSDVLTVMSAGTKVKILELGKAENIDGINSNWVKVEVLSGVKTGTIGWCYGGYLAEITETNNFESTDIKEISNVKIEEEPKQEINIGIVCAIIGAVLLLLLVILIFGVRKKKDNP